MTAKPLMIQGTMSNVGKSLLVAGLARVLVQDGYSVAPFKSQNMALNSFVTADGREMGRAQAMQAQAAGLDPVSDMNPILLKPEGPRGSQVIVDGLSRGTMSARDYFACRRGLAPQVEAAYRRLARTHDIVLIEGAGSPAEINLRATTSSTWAWPGWSMPRSFWWAISIREASSPSWRVRSLLSPKRIAGASAA